VEAVAEDLGLSLLMLTLVFTVAAGFAVHTHQGGDLQPASTFTWRIAGRDYWVGAADLLPAVLDIPPHVRVVSLFTPLVLTAGARFGWKKLLFLSATIWVMAQFGLRDEVHN